jgi:hypothetical protein
MPAFTALCTVLNQYLPPVFFSIYIPPAHRINTATTHEPGFTNHETFLSILPQLLTVLVRPVISLHRQF